jgi:hypothetical protein
VRWALRREGGPAAAQRVPVTVAKPTADGGVNDGA